MEKLTEWFDAERGRRLALTKALKIAPSALKGWKQVPGHHLVEVERITGIHRQYLRPDLFVDMTSTRRKLPVA